MLQPLFELRTAGLWSQLTIVSVLSEFPAPVHAAPTVSIAATDPNAAEKNRDPATLMIQRTGATNAPLNVMYSVAGTATNGTDYDRLPGVATIPAGQSQIAVPVKPIDDSARDPQETVILTLTAHSAYVLGATRLATATIVDNDGPLPVLMVIANNDFYYTEYGTPRKELEAAGIPVVVGAGRRAMSTPHPNSGQGADGGLVMPDIELAAARASDYSAIVFVGGWGASQYQYAFSGTYNNAAYNATPAIRAAANRLINDFVAQDKPVCGLCHGVSVLAWARVNGVSPVRGRQVTTAAFNSPPNNVPEAGEFRWHSEVNGAMKVYVGGAYGNPATYADDVIVDGKIITGGNWDSSVSFGRMVAKRILGR